MKTGRKFAACAAIAAAVVSAMPAAAGAAATVTVTGDDGNPVPISGGPVTIRRPEPHVNVNDDPGSNIFWRVYVLGPDGVQVAAPGCGRGAGPADKDPLYRGNGTYTVVEERFTSTTCQGPPIGSDRWTYTIAASVGLVAPTGILPTRVAGSSDPIKHEIGFAGNPGSRFYDIFAGRDAVLNPDGSLTTSAQRQELNSTTGRVEISFDEPGTYFMVARTGADDFFTPWSPQIAIHTKAPFDLESLRYPDQVGPSFRMLGTIREPTASGKVTIYWARGRKSRRWHRMGRVKIRSATFSKRFSLRPGLYRLRITYRGNSFVFKGEDREDLRVFR